MVLKDQADTERGDQKMLQTLLFFGREDCVNDEHRNIAIITKLYPLTYPARFNNINFLYTECKQR